MNLKEEIKKFFKGDIEDAPSTLAKYSRDASIFEIQPKLVVYPKDSSDLKALVKWAGDARKNDNSISLTVRSAGTDMSGGPLNDSIIIDVTRYMNHIKSVKRVPDYKITPLFPDAKEVTISGEAIVEPGAFYRDFEKEAEKYGLLLPCYTASKSINAIGGMVGNNSGGELTLRFGKTEDYVKELKIVLADGFEYTLRPISRRDLYGKIAQKDFEGELYRKLNELYEGKREAILKARPQVSKNSAGYNIWNIWQNDTRLSDGQVFDPIQLVIGSQGTLGIVTEVTLRLIEPPEKRALAILFLKDLKPLGALVSKILETTPYSFESFDDKTFSLALRYFPEFVKAKGVGEAIKFAFRFLPEFALALSGIPKLLLLVEYAADDEWEARKKAQETLEIAKSFGIKGRLAHDKKDAAKFWDMRRESFSLLRKHSGTRHTVPFIDDIIVRPEFLPEFLPKVNAILAPHKEMIYTIAGHAGNGNFHIIPLMDTHDPKTAEIIRKVSKEVYDLVISYGGSITAEHNDGIIRTPFLKEQFGEEIVKVFEEIKSAFDPAGIFNPHKKVDGTFEMIDKYLVRGEHEAPHTS